MELPAGLQELDKLSFDVEAGTDLLELKMDAALLATGLEPLVDPTDPEL